MRNTRTFARTLGVALVAVTVAAGAALFPDGSSATVIPGLILSQAAGNTAGGTGSVGFALSFNPAATTLSDAVKDVTVDLPPGLLINEQIAGGACLGQSAPAAACLIGSGTAKVNGTDTPMALYLVKGLAGDLAGVQIVAAGLSLPPGDVTFHSSSAFGINPSFLVSEEITFTGIPPAPLNSLNFTLTGLALPNSCTPSAGVAQDDSQQSSVLSRFVAPFSMTGCLALPYNPGVTETIARDSGSTGGVFTATILDPPGDSTTQSIRLRLPANLSLNPALDPCLAGQTCTVGTVTATSPVIPTSQLTGTLTLAGTVRAPAVKVSFPPPVNLQLFSTFSSTAFTLSALPDIPMNTLTFTFTGNSLGRMFIVECYPVPYTATLAPRSGNNGMNLDGAVTETGCAPHPESTPAKPSATATLSGLSAHAPRLALRATAAKGAAGIASVSIRLPSGLRFAKSAISDGRRLPRRALSLTGAKLASLAIRGGALVVSFRRASSSSSLSLGGPLLQQAASGGTHTGSHRAGPGRLSVTITDGRGRRTKLTLALNS